MSRPVTCNRYDFWYRRYVNTEESHTETNISSKAQINIGIRFDFSIAQQRRTHLQTCYKLMITPVLDVCDSDFDIARK